MTEKRKGLVGLTTFFAPARNIVVAPPKKRAWLKWFARKTGKRKAFAQTRLDNSGIPVG